VGQCPTQLSKQSAGERRCVKGSWIEEAQGGTDIAEAIKQNYSLLYHNEIAARSTRIVYGYNSCVNLCALMKPGLTCI